MRARSSGARSRAGATRGQQRPNRARSRIARLEAPLTPAPVARRPARRSESAESGTLSRLVGAALRLPRAKSTRGFELFIVLNPIASPRQRQVSPPAGALPSASFACPVSRLLGGQSSNPTPVSAVSNVRFIDRLSRDDRLIIAAPRRHDRDHLPVHWVLRSSGRGQRLPISSVCAAGRRLPRGPAPVVSHLARGPAAP